MFIEEEVNQAKLKHKDMSEISERYLDNEISLLQDLFQSTRSIWIISSKLTYIIRVRRDSNLAN